MADFLTCADVDLKNKRVLIREDFNVPVKNGEVLNDLRIQAAIPGIQQALNANAQVILMSHLGRPEPGVWQAEYSLQQIIPSLQKLLRQEVTFIKEWPPKDLGKNKVILLENVRFLPGEIENDATLAKQMAALCDVFVMDAFGSAHRAHASTVGVINYAPCAVAGPLLTQEVTALDAIMHNAKRPLIAIIGGAKVSSKLAVLQALQSKVDILIVGGGMANTLLAAQGYNVGDSLYEPEMLQTARDLLETAQQNNCKVILPIDVMTQGGVVKQLTAVHATDKILDIGRQTMQLYAEYIATAATILWNGPVGMFEDPEFAHGTQYIARAIAQSKAFSVAGGGETLTAIDQVDLSEQFSYISTGGGAFLEYIEGNGLPATTALINKRNKC